jgi:hypothetical protein
MSVRPGAEPPRPGSDDAPIVFMAGAVAYWWDENWISPEHYEYLQWRNDLRAALITLGFLVYAHYEAFKGTWNPRAQSINQFALENSDLMVVQTAAHIPSPGTDDEIRTAEFNGIPWVRIDSSVGLARVPSIVQGALNQ